MSIIVIIVVDIVIPGPSHSAEHGSTEFCNGDGNVRGGVDGNVFGTILEVPSVFDVIIFDYLVFFLERVWMVGNEEGSPGGKVGCPDRE